MYSISWRTFIAAPTGNKAIEKSFMEKPYFYPTWATAPAVTITHANAASTSYGEEEEEEENGKGTKVVFTIYSEILFRFHFFFCFVRFFMTQEYARWLNQWVIDSLVSSLNLRSSLCHSLFATFQISSCSCFSCYQRSLKLWVSVRASDRTTKNKMACGPRQQIGAIAHMRFTTWSWFSQLPSEWCSAVLSHWLLLFVTLQFARCLSFTRFLLHDERAYNKTHQNPLLSSSILHFAPLSFFLSLLAYLLDAHSRYSTSLPCAINFVWFGERNAKTTKK